MKIAHVCLDLVPSSGGSVVSVRDFSRVSSHVLISFTDPEKLAREGAALPATVHVDTAAGFFGRAFAWAPAAKRRQAEAALADVDLVVSHLMLRYHVHWVRSMARRRGIPYWAVPHGALDDYVFGYRSLVKKVWFRLFGLPHLKNAACVIFATETERIKARRYYRGDNCEVIRWPVSPLDPGRRPAARLRVRERLGIAASERIVLFLGRLHPLKRPLQTIDAFAKADPAATHLVLVGPDETLTRTQCERFAREAGAQRVHLVGPLYGPEKDDFLLAADLYVSLSEKENFGYTAAEALSAGVPVLLSPGNALAADLAPVGCGWMLSDDAAQSVLVALRHFSETSSELLQEMGARGREWACRELSFDRFAARVREVAARHLRAGRPAWEMEAGGDAGKEATFLETP